MVYYNRHGVDACRPQATEEATARQKDQPGQTPQRPRNIRPKQGPWVAIFPAFTLLVPT